MIMKQRKFLHIQNKNHRNSNTGYPTHLPLSTHLPSTPVTHLQHTHRPIPAVTRYDVEILWTVQASDGRAVS